MQQRHTNNHRQQVGSEIRTLRHKQGLTLDELASAAGTRAATTRDDASHMEGG